MNTDRSILLNTPSPRNNPARKREPAFRFRHQSEPKKNARHRQNRAGTAAPQSSTPRKNQAGSSASSIPPAIAGQVPSHRLIPSMKKRTASIAQNTLVRRSTARLAPKTVKAGISIQHFKAPMYG